MNGNLIESGIVITYLGESLIDNSAILGTDLKLKQFSVGDGGGAEFNPNYDELKALTAIPGEWDKRNLIDVYKNPVGSGFIAEGLVPYDVGEGKFFRIAGYWTEDNILFAVHRMPAWEKPTNNGPMGVELPLKAYFVVSDQANITLVIDPSLVQATKNYVDKSIDSHVHKSLTNNPVNNYLVVSGISHQTFVFDDGVSKNLNVDGSALAVGDVIEVQKSVKTGRFEITNTTGLIEWAHGTAEVMHYLDEGKIGTLFFECVAPNRLRFKGGF